ncbi:Transcriptional regulatory protein OmpR [Sulfitobacter sp. DSM 110093]|uniref:response regulator n=1 Tax=Sulfitobacter sp. DSM 110093 TaxID=2883127 RepID=UPI001FAC9EDD|nr:response regulator transcription factor [Sulfitobacter sp. DSM 110093]UOA32269.1 Transcriptional regulatory protein OmpR [Sulfitobacter sp. DSM 110093]
MTIPRILVVDDDVEMRQMMTQFLHKHGTIALPAATEEEVAAHLEGGRVDLILLDVMLGDESGLDICGRLRQDQDVPIIMVSALSADHQRMEGYAVGADDYIAKPFNPELLLARVKAVLHRTRRSSSLVHRRNTKTFTFAGWTYDAKHNEARAPSGVQVSLSRRETALLRVLLANPHIPLTREEIAAALDVTGEAGPQGDGLGRAIDVLVGRLRAKIEVDPKHPLFLRTERGLGYVFAVDVMEHDR